MADSNNPKVIKTLFDDPLTEDVALEVDENGKAPIDYEDLLANAENIFKSFLYLKKMFSSAPVFNRIVLIQEIDASDYQTIDISPEANLITIKNIDDSKIKVKYNDNDPLTLFQYEQVDFPYQDGDSISVKGKANIIQIKYEIR